MNKRTSALLIDDDAFTYEGVRGDLAPGTDLRVLLNLDECADLGVVADSASVQVNQ